MNLFHSDKTYEDLLQDMQKDGYSQNYMKCVRREIRWLENHFKYRCDINLCAAAELFAGEIIQDIPLCHILQ